MPAESLSGMYPYSKSIYKSPRGSASADIAKQAPQFLSSNVNLFFNSSHTTPSTSELQRRLTNQNSNLGYEGSARRSSLQPLIGQHSPADYLASTSHEMSPLTALPFHRSSFQAKRLSEVGLAVGQQLTARIGLKLPASQERVVEQTRWLCLRYVYMKFRQNSMPTRKLALNRLKPSTSRTARQNEKDIPVVRKYPLNPSMNNQIFIELVNMIKELQSLAPSFYGNSIYEHIGIDKFTSCRNLLNVQKTICQELTRSEITWCSIAALFAIFGAMSLDCLRLGQPEYVCPLLEGFLDFVERDLAWWISQQGGWEAYLYKYQLGSIQQIAFKALIVFLLLTASISILISSLS